MLEYLLDKAVQGEESANVLRFLIQNGAPVKPSHLAKAADTGDMAKVEALLHLGGYIFSELDKAKVAMKAIRNDRCVLLGVLLNAGKLDPNYRHQPTLSLIHYAVSSGNIASVKVLIENGADVNATIQKEIWRTPLHIAVENPDPLLTRLLIEHGADPNGMAASDSKSFTPLHRACRIGSLLTAKELKGADPNCTCRGLTPLHMACQDGHRDVIQWLIREAGANPSPTISSKNVMTPFAMAMKYGPCTLEASFLDRLGMDPWQRNCIGQRGSILHEIMRIDRHNDEDAEEEEGGEEEEENGEGENEEGDANEGDENEVEEENEEEEEENEAEETDDRWRANRTIDILTCRPELIDYVDESQRTALHCAIYNSLPHALVELLLVQFKAKSAA